MVARGREFTVSQAARIINMDRHALAQLCDRKEVSHVVRVTPSGQRRRKIPEAEVMRLRGVEVERRKKIASSTTKATGADSQPLEFTGIQVESKP